jgi:two-component system cell cycle response regulator
MTRATTSTGIGLDDALDPASITGLGGKVLVVDDSPATVQRVRQALAAHYTVEDEADADEALFRAAEGNYELVVISLDLKKIDALRLCSQLRSVARTRSLPILVIVDQGAKARLLRGLEIGVNDYLVRPVDRNEMLARAKTQIRRRRFDDRLRDHVEMTIEMAVIDGLTGLHNRRYLDSHLQTLFDRAVARRRPLSVMITDLDRFKSINDAHGHDGGDDVLREFAKRLRKNVRGIDLACRFGGEEFVVVMPDTDGAVAEKVAERIRAEIAQAPFAIGNDGKMIEVTVSVGVSSVLKGTDTVAALMKRADLALYEAKSGGRNRVVAKAA